MYGKARLEPAEVDFYHMYCFLEKHWITKPSDYEEMDPEIRIGLIQMLQFESMKADKEESKAQAEKTKANMKAKMGL